MKGEERMRCRGKRRALGQVREGHGESRERGEKRQQEQGTSRVAEVERDELKWSEASGKRKGK